MNTSILGCGRWGSFLAWYGLKIGQNVTIWGRKGSKKLQELLLKRKNQYLTLPEDIKITDSLKHTLSFADYLIIAVSAQGLRSLCRELVSFPVKEKCFILCMKGLEETSGKRLTEVFREELGDSCNVAIWVGPGHVQEFIKGVPNCMVIDSSDFKVTRQIVYRFGSPLIRFYYGQDLIGNEIGAASKNVIGIAAGMLDGLGLTSLKGALMARGAREISRLVKAMGGKELTVYGLSHIGDYEATLFSSHSHNRRFGEMFVKGEIFEKLAEGLTTVKALKILSERYKVDLPICEAVYSITVKGKEPLEVLKNLFLRPTKFEF